MSNIHLRGHRGCEVNQPQIYADERRFLGKKQVTTPVDQKKVAVKIKWGISRYRYGSMMFSAQFPNIQFILFFSTNEVGEKARWARRGVKFSFYFSIVICTINRIVGGYSIPPLKPIFRDYLIRSILRVCIKEPAWIR